MKVITTLAACLTLTSGLLAQTAQVSGFVKDQSGAVVPQARLTITNEDSGSERKTVTNESGVYTFAALPPGGYTLTVEANGFQTQKREDIKLEVAQNASLDVALSVGKAEATVTVTGEVTPANTQDASVSTVVNRQFVENVPLNGRSMQALIALTPGVVTVMGASTNASGEFSVNGQRTDANNYLIGGGQR